MKTAEERAKYLMRGIEKANNHENTIFGLIVGALKEEQKITRHACVESVYRMTEIDHFSVNLAIMNTKAV